MQSTKPFQEVFVTFNNPSVNSESLRHALNAQANGARNVAQMLKVTAFDLLTFAPSHLLIILVISLASLLLTGDWNLAGFAIPLFLGLGLLYVLFRLWMASAIASRGVLIEGDVLLATKTLQSSSLGIYARRVIFVMNINYGFETPDKRWIQNNQTVRVLESASEPPPNCKVAILYLNDYLYRLL